MGLTFKENCPDIRNTRVVDIIDELKEYNCEISVFDPWIKKSELKNTKLSQLIIDKPKLKHYDAAVLAVGHKQFKKLGANGIRAFLKSKSIFYDIKSIFNKDLSDIRL